MGLIDIIKPLYTALSSAINKSQQHQEKNSWERQELLGGSENGIHFANKLKFALYSHRDVITLLD